MLREFNERDAPRRRSVATPGEFWLGVVTVMIACSLIVGWFGFFAG